MRLFLAVALAGLVLAAGLLDRLPWLLALAYVLTGLVSFALYRADKNMAVTRQRRISEVTLLGVDLCGGIIGGLLSQELFRHKTRKASYIARTLLIALVHMLALAGLLAGFFRL